MNESPGERRLDAEEVNRLASELDNQPFRAVPVDDDSDEGTVPAARQGQPANLEHLGPDPALFPIEPDNLEEIGQSVDERAVLREEESR